MRYPVGKGTADFLTNWYNAQGYGVKTSYGYHEGDDYNLRSGGNTDLGQPIYAITDGEVSSLHDHATGFGRHLHIFHPSFKVWSHYAHLQDIQVVPGQQVREGQQIGTLGKSGTEYAHLHFAIKNQPTGVDGIAKTLADLSKWENPTEFIKKHLSTGGNMPNELEVCMADRSKFWKERDEALAKLEKEIQEHKKTAVALDESKQFAKQLGIEIDSYKKHIAELNDELENGMDTTLKEYIQVGDSKLRINGGQWNGGNYEVVERK